MEKLNEKRAELQKAGGFLWEGKTSFFNRVLWRFYRGFIRASLGRKVKDVCL